MRKKKRKRKEKQLKRTPLGYHNQYDDVENNLKINDNGYQAGPNTDIFNEADSDIPTIGKQIQIQINVFGLKGCVITHVSLR